MFYTEAKESADTYIHQQSSKRKSGMNSQIREVGRFMGKKNRKSSGLNQFLNEQLVQRVSAAM